MSRPETRDGWMRASGPLYPFVCALASASALSLFRTLTATREDRARAAPWLVIVGLAVGVAAAVVAVLGAKIAMAPAAAAALGVVTLALIFGGHREDRVARLATSAAAGAAAIASAVVLTRLALVWGIAAGDWAGAFIASQITGLWAGLMAAHVAALVGDRGDEDATRSIRNVALAGLAGIVLATAAGGMAGLVGVIMASAVAATIGFVAGHKKLSLAATDGAVQLVGELVCLVAFAALASAEMSPWVSY